MTEIKSVLVETFLEENPDRVCVYEFNEHVNDILIDIEVCSKDEAYNKYHVVGEVSNGLIYIFGEDSDEEELDMYDEDFEETDDE